MTTRVYRKAPGTSPESALGLNRAQDSGAFLDTTGAEDTGRGRGRTPSLTPLESEAQDKLMSEVIAHLQTKGASTEEIKQVLLGVQSQFLPNRLPGALTYTEKNPTLHSRDEGNAFVPTAINTMEQEEEGNRVAAIAASDQLFASVRRDWTISAIRRTWERLEPKGDPTWDRWAHAKDEEGLSYDDKLWLDRSGSEAEYQVRRKQLHEADLDSQVLRDGPMNEMAAMLASGMLEPTNYLISAAAMKGFQAAKIGSKMLEAAGASRSAVIASAAAESAVGEVLTEATLDALGEDVSGTDYLMAILLGGGVGTLTRFLETRGYDAASVKKPVADTNVPEVPTTPVSEAVVPEAVVPEAPSAVASAPNSVPLGPDDIKLGEVRVDAPTIDTPTVEPVVVEPVVVEPVAVSAPKVRTVKVAKPRVAKPKVSKVKVEQPVLDEVSLDDVTLDTLGVNAADTTLDDITLEDVVAADTSIDKPKGVKPRGRPRKKPVVESAKVEPVEVETPDLFGPEGLNVQRADEAAPDLVEDTTTTWADVEVQEDSMNPVAAEVPINAELVQALAEDNLAQAADTLMQREVEYYAKAQAELGPDATKQELSQHVYSQRVRDMYAAAQSTLYPLPDNLRFIKNMEDLIDPETGEVLPPKTSLETDPELDAYMEKYKLKERLGPHGYGDARLLAHLLAQADRINASVDVDAARLNPLLSKSTWLAETANTLLTSDKPLLRAIGRIVTSSSTRAVGSSDAAAVVKYNRYGVYMNSYQQAMREFSVWSQARGGGELRDMLWTQNYNEFNTQLQRYRWAKYYGDTLPEVDPAVVRASDLLDEGYTAARLDAQKVGTVGHARLGREVNSSHGYFNLSFDSARLRRATRAELDALHETMAAQLVDVAEWDLPFAKQFAHQYIARGLAEASGGQQLAANVFDPHAADTVQDVMRALGVDLKGPQGEQLLSKFSRGASRFTKERIRWQLNDTIVASDGTTFVMADFFNKDMFKGYQEYMARMSGEVALARVGIYGTPTIRAIEQALLLGDTQPTPQEWDALRQVFGEMMHSKISLAGVSADGKISNRLRMFVSAVKLGWALFPQAAEVTNAIPLMGVEGAMRMVKDIPQAVSDLRAGRTNAFVDQWSPYAGDPAELFNTMHHYFDHGGADTMGYHEVSWIDRGLRAMQNVTFIYSGNRIALQAQLRTVTEHTFSNTMKYIRDGQDSKALLEMGISSALRERLLKDIDNLVTFNEEGKIVNIHLDKAKDIEARGQLVQAITVGSRQIILGTFVGESGKYVHDSLAKLITQFRDYSIKADSKMRSRNYQAYGGLYFAQLVAWSAAVAVPLHLARIQLMAVGREDREEYIQKMTSPAMLSRATMNYVSTLGVLGDALDFGAAATGGEASQVRGGGAGVFGAVPVAGAVGSAVVAAREHSLVDLTKSITPNLPVVVNGLNVWKSVVQENEESDQ